MSESHGKLDKYLESTGADAFLIEADSSVSDQYFLSNFEAPDPFITLYTPKGIHLLVAGMEVNRARTESVATTVKRNEAYGAEGRIHHFGTEQNSTILSQFVTDCGVERVGVPDWLPVGTVDGLRAQGHDVTVDMEDVLLDVRATKSPTEVNHIRRTQKINEGAMNVVEQLLAEATVRDGVLYHDGDVLTSERVRAEIEIYLLQNGHDHAEFTPVVACGSDAADPHKRGQGSLLADESIIVDIFPRSKETRYHGDLTRTFVKGEPSPELREQYDIVEQAQQAALKYIGPDVQAAAVHDRVCDVFESEGYETVRSNPMLDAGFMHRTGHGVGLDVHEKPRLSSKGGVLRPGMVVTVEPGLYIPAVGGVRIEDLVMIVEDGYENLTNYSKELVIA